ncbi:MAG: hypothetical protein R3286_12875 [Gammaproteobacteria bacterium]|nr:hypothetical protein [Gammaproteobacteria bacterium]
MPSDSKTLYPMLGVGAFMTMFFAGIVLAHEIGLACTALLAVGLLCACLGAVLVSELERRDRAGRGEGPRGAPRKPAPSAPLPAAPAPPRRPRRRWLPLPEST